MTRAWGVLPLALLLLGGCGMYGPLYLEESDPPAAAPAPAADPTPDEDRDPDEKHPGAAPDEGDPAGSS